MPSGPDRASPVSIAVFVSLGILVFVLFCFVAIGGAYALSLHQIDAQRAQDAAFQAKAAAAQVRASIPGCRTLTALNTASHAFATDRHQDTIGHHLATAIEGVYNSTHCGELLAWVKDKVPFTVIARRLGMGG